MTQGSPVADRGGKRKFEDPIPLPRGRELVTLEDAARYIQKLPSAEQQIEEWQTAVEVLILVAESNGGPTMLARIGVMRALNRHVERVFNPERKDHHWGKLKLKLKRIVEQPRGPTMVDEAGLGVPWPFFGGSSHWQRQA